MAKLVEMFKIPNNIGIILPMHNVIHSSPYLGGIPTFVNQLFIGLRLRSYHRFKNFFVK